MTTILSLDTTSRHTSVAVAQDEQILVEYNFTPGESLSSVLLPVLRGVLDNLSLELEDIDLFGICVGPGLFTGIRVGLSSLKGLLLGKNKPIVPVLSLEALALKVAAPGFTLVPMVDARRKEVYMAAYRVTTDTGTGMTTDITTDITQVLEPALVGVDELGERLKDFSPCCFTGSGATVYRDTLAGAFDSKHPVMERSNFLAPEICRLALHRFRAGRHIEGPGQLMPFYIRKPDAEVNYNG